MLSKHRSHQLWLKLISLKALVSSSRPVPHRRRRQEIWLGQTATR